MKFVREKTCYSASMTLKNLSDKDLLAATKSAVHRERETTMEVLRHLQELERRRLFADLGFSSLFVYAMAELKYSEDQALRRISAMRLLKELPEIEEKIKDGGFTLTNLAKAQTYFRHKKKSSPLSTEEKREFLKKLENKSSREAEKILLALAPTCQGRERIKPVSPENLEFRFTAPAELLEKINELKALLAHSHPSASLAEIFSLAVDLIKKDVRADGRKIPVKPKSSQIHLLRPRSIAISRHNSSGRLGARTNAKTAAENTLWKSTIVNLLPREEPQALKISEFSADPAISARRS